MTSARRPHVESDRIFFNKGEPTVPMCTHVLLCHFGVWCVKDVCGKAGLVEDIRCSTHVLFVFCHLCCGSFTTITLWGRRPLPSPQRFAFYKQDFFSFSLLIFSSPRIQVPLKIIENLHLL